MALTTPSDETMKQYIQIINEYFITSRSKFLHQLRDGSYVTCPNGNSQKKPLNDYNIEDHLRHRKTYGILVNRVTKFILFDIDGSTLANAGHMKYILINFLVDLGFERDYIFTVFSGHKGYHVYLFLEEPYSVDVMNIMQFAIIQKLENLYQFSHSLGFIEMRPTSTQGVKLPLGLHQGTKQTCWFCDETNQLIKSYDVLFALKKVPNSMMDKVFAKIKYNNNNDHCLSLAIRSLAPFRNVGISSEKIQRCKEAYETGIVAPHTRHNTLYSAAIYLKVSGKTQAQCQEEMTAWMNKQNSDVITTPRSMWQYDVDRVVKDIYAKDRSSSPRSEIPDLYITKDLIRYIYQNTNVKNERIVLLLMVINFVKYEERAEDGGFRASATHIARDAHIGLSSAKTIPSKLAARKLIVRKTNKPSANPLVKTSSLFGNPVTWYTLNDALINLVFDAMHGLEKRLMLDPNLNLYEQMNFYLHQEFSEEEIRQWLKRDAYNTSDRLYKDFYIKHIANPQAKSLCNLTS